MSWANKNEQRHFLREQTAHDLSYTDTAKLVDFSKTIPKDTQKEPHKSTT
jgi:hypothetical protein